MKFSVYGEKVVITEAMREKIENRLSCIKNYVIIDEQSVAKITVKIYGGNSLKVEVGVPSKLGLLRSEVVHDDFSTAIDLAIDKLEDQIRRQKSRLSKRHKESLADNFYEDNFQQDIPVRTKSLEIEEMDLDEAILRMEMLSHSFFVYKDSENGKTAVVYKRNIGGYGLLEIND